MFSDERRAEVQRRATDGWRVEDLIGKAEIGLSCCDSPILLDSIYHDILVHDSKAPNILQTMKRNVSTQDFDRLPSIMFLQSGDDYIRSSHLLNEGKNELDMYFGMPPFLLCGHAFELLLKAFLRATGWSVKQLATRLGHDLRRLYQKAVEGGLQNNLDHNEKMQLDLLASLSISPHFHSRYTQIGGLAKPELLVLYHIYEKLNAEIRPVVEADFESWRRGIIGDGS
jgi:hypothetical protein